MEEKRGGSRAITIQPVVPLPRCHRGRRRREMAREWKVRGLGATVTEERRRREGARGEEREAHEEEKPATSLVTVSAAGCCRQPRELPPCRRYCAAAPPFNLIPPCLYRRYCSEVFAVDSDFVLFRLKPLLPLVARKPPLLLLPRPCFVRVCCFSW